LVQLKEDVARNVKSWNVEQLRGSYECALASLCAAAISFDYLINKVQLPKPHQPIKICCVDALVNL
jgi:hypothetical protein